MRETKITPGSNAMWESSRWILPEHREALLEFKKEQSKKKKPELDEQQLEELARIIREAHHEGHTVTITVFGEFQDKTFTGRITRIDPQLQQIKLEDGEEFYWIKWKDIIEVG